VVEHRSTQDKPVLQNITRSMGVIINFIAANFQMPPKTMHLLLVRLIVFDYQKI